MANLANPVLPLLHARPLQRGNVNSASVFTEIRLLQPNNLCGKSDAASAKIGRRNFRCKAQAQNCGAPPRNAENARLQKSKVHLFLASVSSSGSETASVGASSPVPPPPPPTTYIGSPLLWIGVGVGISALFAWVANSVKRYAMQQFLKTMMGQTTPVSQPGGMPIPAGSGFPIPPFPVPPSIQTSPVPPRTSPQTQTVDVSATEVTTQPSEANGVAEKQEKPKKPAFVDVSPDEVLAQNIYAGKEEDSTEKISAQDSSVSQGQAFTQAAAEASSRSAQSTGGKAGPILTVEALEKMMEDPTVQKMVYPYLPQEMQNPATFKWMMQNPQYRQQLEEMLNNMGGDAAWDNQMMESLKIFDLNSQDVKQQFEQIGLTPEEVISKIMANPDVAMAFQNPRVQAAIMDCSQNPLSITKYQNDKEVMDVFNKISELFPGMTGSPW